MIRLTTVTQDPINIGRRSIQKNDRIELSARFTAKLPTTSYKSKIIRFKMNEYTLQRRFYFITFVESLEMIISQYKETCEVLLDYPKIGGESIKLFSKKAIRNILYDNIGVHIRRLIAEFPADGIKFIAKLQSHCGVVPAPDDIFISILTCSLFTFILIEY